MAIICWLFFVRHANEYMRSARVLVSPYENNRMPQDYCWAEATNTAQTIEKGCGPLRDFRKAPASDSRTTKSSPSSQSIRE